MNQIDPCISSPRIYSRFPGDADRVYGALCAALAGREVDWAAFTNEDWALLALMARPDLEGVGPAIYWRFQHSAWPPEMPEGVRKLLERTFYNTTANNLLLYRELALVLDALEAASIPVIVLKGAALAVTIYEDFGLRPMGDLDLLVRPADVRQACRILEQMGYALLSANTEIGLQKLKGPETRIDLHWCLISGFSSLDHDIDWFQKPQIGFQLPDGLGTGRTLSAEWQLAYLASHAYSQRLLRAYYDLYILKQVQAPELQMTEKYLAEAGWGRIGRVMLEKSGSLFSEIEGQTVGAEDEMVVPQSRSLILRASLVPLDVRTRMFVLRHVIFPTRTYLEWRYQRRISLSLPFWMLVRWLDIMADFAWSSRRQPDPFGTG